MMRRILGITFLMMLSSLCGISAQERSGLPKTKVGLLVMATGKYTIFLQNLFESAQKYFLPGCEVTYFVFTDGEVPTIPNVVKIHQERLGWPHDTMMRFKVYYEARAHYRDIDYLFACDADMLFVDTVGNEILGDRVATRHPGFCLPGMRHDDYEKNPLSTACIPNGQGDYYFAGGFYGGITPEFLKICQICTEHIMEDLSHNYIAIWHDESHLNRYFFDNKPTTILSPSYCYPDIWRLPFPKKLLALTKNHKEFQTAK
jgi:histo-blood group ABO system transferase